MTRLALGDISLNVERWGAGPPLVLLHGFAGSAETWRPFAGPLGRRFELIAVDLIGHGQSDAPADPDRYRVERCVDDIVAVLDCLDRRRVHLLGYSMGGRVALPLALAHPDRVAALVVESASPGIVDAGERASRVVGDEALATLIETRGLAAFVDRWENIPLFASQKSLAPAVLARQRAQRLRHEPAGLANSLRGLGAGASEPLHHRLGEIRSPTLVVVGALDEKYVELGRRLATTMPDARLEIVPAAGHAVHLEQPEEFARLVEEFLSARTI